MIKNVKFSGYYFDMNLNTWGSFQICISVPLKIFQSLVFLLCTISSFDVCFQKTRSNLARECDISDNNRKKLDES